MTILVISGGGLWTTAAIGAAAALRDMGVVIDGYVGSSAGAWMAALLAAGHSPDTLSRVVLSLKPRDLHWDWKAWAQGARRGQGPVSLYRMDRLVQRIRPLLADQKWNTLAHPLWVIATSLTHFQPLVFGPTPPSKADTLTRFHLAFKGQTTDLWAALMASAAVPALFPPVFINGEWLVDGGVTDDYPVDVAQWAGATDVIGIWVDEKRQPIWPPRFHAGHVAGGALAAMIRELSLVRQSFVTIPHIDIRIEIDGGHRVFNRLPEIIQKGYDQAWSNAMGIRTRLHGQV